jgi:alkanesulfonate monooxygenase SsuD/methylene tetrahydromethanopterin reductase-like flavin-dependent oxidoreductase (luciferase family)
VDISIGLPNTLHHDGPLIVDWARRAEERGFTSLGTLDRIVYPSFDTMTTLAVAAGATSRIRLLPGILLTPLYPPVWLAKAASTLNAVSGGRLTLGLGVGGREDDFAAMGRDPRNRGRDMDEALDTMRTVWAGPRDGDAFPVAPVTGGVPLLIGGTSDAAIRRTVRYGTGWIAGGALPDQLPPFISRVKDAWHDAGREGEPRIAALAYFGLSDESASRSALLTYYGFLGDAANYVAGGALRSPEAIRDAIGAYAAAGVDELIINPTVADLAEVDRLADAALRPGS